MIQGLLSETNMMEEGKPDHQIVHSEKRPYSCELCEKIFKTNGETMHFRLIHTDKASHKCKSCKTSFIRITDL